MFQSDIAKILDVCEDTITGWENGRNKPLVYHYPKLIQFLGYNPFPVETETLGGRIKQFRVEHGISQEKLAGMVGVDKTSILAWEANKRIPVANKLKLLKEIVNKKIPS